MRTAKDEEICVIFFCFCIVQGGQTIGHITCPNVTGQLTDKISAKADRTAIIDADYVIAKFDIGAKLCLISVHQCAVRATVGEENEVFVAR